MAVAARDVFDLHQLKKKLKERCLMHWYWSFFSFQIYNDHPCHNKSD